MGLLDNLPGTSLVNALGGLFGTAASTIKPGAGTSNDLLSQFQGSQLGGVDFPAIVLGMKGGHHLVHHARVDCDGVFVENLGQKGQAFHVVAPMVNGIAPGLNEQWGSQALYPDTYQDLLTQLQVRDTQTFTHPYLGQLQVKVGDYSDELNADYRGGTILQFDLFVTIDDLSAVPLTNANPASLVGVAANDVAPYAGSLNPNPVGPGGLTLDGVLAVVNGVLAIGSEFSLLTSEIQGKILQCCTFMQNVDDMFGATTPGLSPALQGLIFALRALYRRAQSSAKPTAYWIVTKPCTLDQVSIRLARLTTQTVDSATLLKLNPLLARTPVIPTDTAVKYYA
jgi:hypothetical protein